MTILRTIWNGARTVVFIVVMIGVLAYYALRPGWRYDWERGPVRTDKGNQGGQS